MGEQQIHLIGETESGRAREMTPRYDEAEVVIGYGTHLALVVDDLDAALQRAAAAGVTPPGEVFARGDGIKRVFVTDPDGAARSMRADEPGNGAARGGWSPRTRRAGGEGSSRRRKVGRAQLVYSERRLKAPCSARCPRRRGGHAGPGLVPGDV